MVFSARAFATALLVICAALVGLSKERDDAQQTTAESVPSVVGQSVAVSGGAKEEQTVSTERVVDYNWDVRPILSENCFSCHGPDEKSRRAGLRLDISEGAYGELRTGTGRRAVVPGRPADSELLKRAAAANVNQRMPPRVTNKALTPSQIETLTDWIRQGARYKPHWSFIAPSVTAESRASQRPGVVNRIDSFVRAKLARERLSPSPSADKESLINRLTFTLTGLPPSLAEIDAFLSDKSPDAYEKIVDRLLASPAYGEHMAAQWLDIARYAESDGFLDDFHDRLFWPYRDWVISAFNKNLPFDQFVTWQLAGDLMPRASTEQILATAFLRLGKRTTENGAIDEEYRVEYAIDRAVTVGTGLLGLTVGCARCHDHKYDPISHKDFYSFMGFFNSTDEPGFYAPGRTGITAGPTLRWPDVSAAAKLKNAESEVAVNSGIYERVLKTASANAMPKADELLRSPRELKTRVEQSIARRLMAHYSFDGQPTPVPDDQLPTSRARNRRLSPPLLAPLTNRAGGRFVPSNPANARDVAADVADTRPALPADLVRDALVWSPSSTPGFGPAVLEAPILKPGIVGNALYFDDTNRGFFPANVGDFERTDAFSLDFWLLPAQVYDDAPVFTHREYDWFGNAGYQISLENNRVKVELLHSRAGNRLAVVSRDALPVSRWTHITVTYDGSSRAQGLMVYVDGQRADRDVISDNLTRTILPNGGGALGDEFLGLAFGKRFRLNPLKGSALDEVRVFSAAMTALEVRYLHDSRPAGSSVDPLRQETVEWLASLDRQVISAWQALKEKRDAQNRLISVIPEVPVMGDTLQPRENHVLGRGQYDQHGERVPTQALSQIFAWNPDWPRNRLGLAKWLFEPGNPLPSRVFVNRVWQQTFGRGLVETAEDFGSQGSIPTHPELLDWLSVTFQESGWDVKRLQKLIVMSATYRQSSVATQEHLQKDPRNLLLARASRMRLTAEMVRDSALAVSGLLVKRVGGPSVYPYQPDGLWEGLSGYSYPKANQVAAEEHHRRTLYSFVKRNSPHPAMAAFDFPDRGSVLARRQASNTPLQALALLNDPQYREAYRALAERVLGAGPDDRVSIALAFRLSTRRQPSPAEITTLQSYFLEQLTRMRHDTILVDAILEGGGVSAARSPDRVRLAAMTNVITAIMNSPAAYTLR
jgi:mono/diheme cytochrome c family protein